MVIQGILNVRGRKGIFAQRFEYRQTFIAMWVFMDVVEGAKVSRSEPLA